MRQLRHLQHRVTGVSAFLAVSAVAFVAPAVNAAEPSKPFRSDPVEELKQALKQDKFGGRSKQGQKFREETLARLEKQLITASDLGRALILKDLKDNSPDLGLPGGEPESERELRRIDLNFRKTVAKRFLEAERKIFADPKAERGAAAALVGELAVSARDNIRSPIVQATLVALVPDLVKLTRSDADVALREIALRSLGKISGAVADKEGAPVKNRFASDESVPALVEALQPKSPLSLRREAAAALGELVHDLPENYKNARGQSPIGPPLSPEEYLRICELVFGAAGKGLADADATVRASCVSAIKLAGEAVSDYIPLPARREDFPAEGRKDLTKEEIAEITRLHERNVRDNKELEPVLTAFKNQAPGLARIMKAAESSDDLRFAAARAVEEMGYARLRLLNRAASIPVIEEKAPKPEGEEKKPVGKLPKSMPARLVAAQKPVILTPDPLLEGLKAALPTLANRSAHDPDLRVRTRAVETMESMGDDASPAWEFLRYALRPDENRFVQWAAARALGRMTPAKAHAKEVSPYLAGLLLDPDLDVRLNVARTLESFGPDAASPFVVSALARAAGIEEDTSPWPPAHGIEKGPGPGTGDAEARVGAIRALAAIGTASTPAVPKLASVLSDPEVRVRRASAEALGRFGASAKDAEPALRRALHVEDAEVRRLASDALLNLKVK
jgi:HEAT repeat protein